MKPTMIPDGIIPPLLTPLTADQHVDIPAFVKLINKQVSAGTPALFVCGTAGLGSVLTIDQYENVISTAMETVPEGYPLLFGVLESSTVRNFERIKLLESLKAGCFICITPYYLRATEKKCTAQPFRSTQGKEVGLRVFQGLAPKFDWLNEIGASGCVPVPANCHPELFNKAWSVRADQEQLLQVQTQVDEVWNKLVVGTDYISQSIKQLSEEGIGSGTLMLPFTLSLNL